MAITQLTHIQMERMPNMVHALIFNELNEEIASGLYMSELDTKKYLNVDKGEYYVVCKGCKKCDPIIKPIRRMSIASKILITSGVILLGIAAVQFIFG
ncbi:MAG: hypothetical protein BWY19_00777 [bacterium ADurb.Bin212]|nr:MAG: hypothetical protein BWY19_00777 [bacterium ADurb.Bin212]